MDKKMYMTQIRRLQQQFGFDFVSIGLVLKEPHPLLNWVYAVGNKNQRFHRIVLESGRGVAGGVHKTGKAMVIQNVPQELSVEEQVHHPITLTEELRSLIALPLWQQNAVEGVLLMAFRQPEKISPQLYEAVGQALGSSFCNFTIRPCPFDQVLHSGSGMPVDPVPIYDLMNCQILQAQEEERRYIAQELHDSVVPELLGIQIQLRSVKYQTEREQALALVEDADAHLTKVQNALRALSASLRPPALDELGLVAALRSYFLWIKDAMGMTVHFSENVGFDRYSERLETDLYRICQEAVLNACKYSGCSEMEVSLIKAEDRLTLMVTDHGHGFTQQDNQDFGSGFGLRSMAERTEFIHGEFHIVSESEKGTCIRVSAPTERRESL